MTIDWTLLLAKKAELNKKAPTAIELGELETTAADVLRIPMQQRATTWGLSLGYGMRTTALIATAQGVDHCFLPSNQQVVVKLFRGPAKDFIAFHQADSRNLSDILHRPELQRSIEAGVLPSGNGFAILEYIKGKTLKSWFDSPERCDASESLNVLRLLLKSIWIPLWNRGLRFKDCHSGNFIVRSSVPQLVMIDCEQMRKSAAELLRDQNNWNQRDAHQASAFRRLPNLIESFSLAWKPNQNKTELKRMIRAELEHSELIKHLSELGRSSSGTTDPATTALSTFIDVMVAAGMFSEGE